MEFGQSCTFLLLDIIAMVESYSIFFNNDNSRVSNEHTWEGGIIGEGGKNQE
jgi:hypothetical protein